MLFTPFTLKILRVRSRNAVLGPDQIAQRFHRHPHADLLHDLGLALVASGPVQVAQHLGELRALLVVLPAQLGAVAAADLRAHDLLQDAVRFFLEPVVVSHDSVLLVGPLMALAIAAAKQAISVSSERLPGPNSGHSRERWWVMRPSMIAAQRSRSASTRSWIITAPS